METSMSRFVRCEYCGNTYGDAEPWCPHCLAPRPDVDVKPEPKCEDTRFYADNVCYMVIPSPYGTVERM